MLVTPANMWDWAVLGAGVRRGVTFSLVAFEAGPGCSSQWCAGCQDSGGEGRQAGPQLLTRLRS